MKKPLGDAVEGVTKFHTDFRLAPPPSHARLSELEGWRRLFHRLGMIGRMPNRYGGLAYGNVSLRLAGGQFLISGTQTGEAPRLGASGYCCVESWNLTNHSLRAAGPVRPSSEALSHAALYQANSSIGSVIHVHCPDLWNAAREGRILVPVTPPELEYGTAELAAAVAAQALLSAASLICMGGHEDGILAYGEEPESAASALLHLFVESLVGSEELKS